MNQLLDVVNLTRQINAEKHHLYVLGYLMQEAGEFAEAASAISGFSDMFVPEHAEHDIEEGADVVQNVISNLAMVTDRTADQLVNGVLHAMSSIGGDNRKDPVASNGLIGDCLSILSMSIGRLAESTMIVGGDITHKSKDPDIFHDSALVIHNTIMTIQANRPELSVSDIVMQICTWIEEKNAKWVAIS